MASYFSWDLDQADPAKVENKVLEFYFSIACFTWDLSLCLLNLPSAQLEQVLKLCNIACIMHLQFDILQI
jgi:hypothetical protein